MSFPPCSTHLYCLMSPTRLHGSDSCSDISSSGVPPGALFTTSRWLLRWSDCDMYRWLQESTTCPLSEWLSSRPLKFGKVIPIHSWEQPSLHPQHSLLLKKFSPNPLYSLNMLMTGLWFYNPFFVSWPLPIQPMSHLWAHFILFVQVSGSFLYFPTLDPLINGMLFFKLHKRPAY